MAAVQQGSEAPAGAPGAADRRAATGALSAATRTAVLLLAVGALGALLIYPDPRYPGNMLFLTRLFARREDIPVAIGLVALFVLCGLLRAGTGTGVIAERRLPALGGAGALMLAGGLVLTAWLIRTRVLFDYDFTRDEQMASFDAAIYAAGHLFASVPPALRALYTPLNDLFLFPVSDHSAAVSNYLPVNALIRAGLGKLMPLALVSPLLAGLSAVLLWRIAGRIWPGERDTQTVVLLCLVGSSQVVLIGTAAFAMTAHLAFNLLWLACFLRGTRGGHAGAMVTGLFATGIHQPLFHPLFVLPFLDLLRRRREWRTLACYLLAYAAIALVWLAWPHWVMAQIAPGPGPGALAAAGQVGLIERLAGLLVLPGLDSLWAMAGNVLRFITWQHALLVPLALLGLRHAADDLARALAAGVVLLLVAVAVLMPVQGHGWGYRYLHGLIGNCCLLGGYGWSWLRARGAAPARAMAIGTTISVLVLVPLHAAMVRAFVAPFAEARAAVARTDADFVVFETGRIPFDSNFVINRPDFANRPLTLASSALTPAGIAALCPGRTIAFADASRFAAVSRFYEDPPAAGPGQALVALRDAAANAGCRIVPFAR